MTALTAYSLYRAVVGFRSHLRLPDPLNLFVGKARIGVCLYGCLKRLVVKISDLFIAGFSHINHLAAEIRILINAYFLSAALAVQVI